MPSSRTAPSTSSERLDIGHANDCGDRVGVGHGSGHQGDIRDADIVADLGTVEGRVAAIAAVGEVSGGAIDGLVTWAGLPGLTDRPGSLLVSVNYFGTISLLDGLRPLLAKGDRPAAVAISSNSTTCQPGVPMDVVERCLAGDEDGARAAADVASSTWYCAAGTTSSSRTGRPGAVETPLLQASRQDPVIGEMVDAFPVPIGRKAAPDELAAFVQFLLGPDARFFCGSVVFVDGGTDAQFRADAYPSPM